MGKNSDKLSFLVDEFKNSFEYKESFFDKILGDFHSSNAVAIYGDEFIKAFEEGNHKKLRSIAKTVGLALLYGGTAYTICDKIKGMTESEAEDIIDKFYSGVPNLKKLHKYQDQLSKTEGYTRNIFGAIRYIPFAKETFTDEYRNDPVKRKMFFKRKAKSFRLALNHPIQSAGSIQILLIISRIMEWAEKNRLYRFGNLMSSYRPYSRVAYVEYRDDVDYSSLEKDLDDLDDGVVKFIIIDGDSVKLEYDRNVKMTEDFIERYSVKYII